MPNDLSEPKPVGEKDDVIKLIIADDHPMMRNALRNLLDKQSDMKVIAEAKDGEEAVSNATKLIPDVVVMDIRMPKLNGLEATRQIKEKVPQVIVLILTVHDDIEYVLEILDAGAAGYLLKSADEKEIVQAIRGVVAGESVLSSKIMMQILKNAQKSIVKSRQLTTKDDMTSREIEILRYAAMGLSNKDIASELGLSVRTVKGYFETIFSKLNVASRTEAVVIGLQRRYFSLDDVQTT